MTEILRQLHDMKLYYKECALEPERQIELLQNNIGLFMKRAKNQCDGQFKDNQSAKDIMMTVISELEYMTSLRIEREGKDG